MIDLLKNMPLLAIVLIGFLTWIGVRAIRPRTISYRQLYILPSVFLFISANQMFNTYTVNLDVILIWATASVLTAGVSVWIAKRTAINIDRKAGRISLPGTWITLSLILFFIVARLYFGRQLYVTPELRTDTGFAAQIIAMSGLVTGYYLGRSGVFLIRYFRTKT